MPPKKSVDTQETLKAVVADTKVDAVVADTQAGVNEVEKAVVAGDAEKEVQALKETILPADESKQINTELLSNIKTELEKTTIGPEKTELLLSKIGELTPSTMASKIRTYAEGLNNA